jgi:hypothetical protein
VGAKPLFWRAKSLHCIFGNQSLALKEAVASIMQLALFLSNHNLIITIAIDPMNNKRSPAPRAKANDDAARRRRFPNDARRSASRLPPPPPPSRRRATAASYSDSTPRHNGIPVSQVRQSTQPHAPSEKRKRDNGVNGKEVCNLERHDARRLKLRYPLTHACILAACLFYSHPRFLKTHLCLWKRESLLQRR